MERALSSKPRRQRKWHFDKPLHASRKDFSMHLSRELRKQVGARSLVGRKGDTVRVMRGGEKVIGKQGKITAVLREKRMVLVEGIVEKKASGTERQIPLRPSNLVLVALDEKDAKRFGKGARAKKNLKQEEK